MASAPPLRYPPLGAADLEVIVRGYEQITRKAVRRLQQRHFIATCWRLQGSSFLELVRLLFDRMGTDQNLLGILRTTTPEDIELFLARRAQEPDEEPPLASSSRAPVAVAKDPQPMPVPSHWEPGADQDYEGFFAPHELGERSAAARAIDR